MPALDTSVKWYQSSQSGAPALTNSAGKLLDVLNACLVDGFGQVTCNSVSVSSGVATATINGGHSALERSVVTIAGATPSGLNGDKKVITVSSTQVLFDAFGVADGAASGTITLKVTPAGWTKPYTGTNIAVYRSPDADSTQNCFRFTDTGTTVARMLAYTSMSDVNTGLNPYPTDAQRSGGTYVLKASGSGNRQWFICANSRFVYLLVGDYTSYPDQHFAMAFGDTVSRKANDAYRGIVLMANQDCTNTASKNGYMPFAVGASAERWMARSYIGIGIPTAVAIAFAGSVSSQPSGYGNLPFPNPVDNAVLFSKFVIFDSTATGAPLRGTLPGGFATAHLLGDKILDTQIYPPTASLAKHMLLKRTGYNGTNYGGMFFDLTGPWDK